MITELELIALVVNVFCLYLVIKKHPINWLVSIVACIPLIIIFYQRNLQGQILIQIIYIIQSIFGFIEWKKHSNLEQNKTEILKFNFKENVVESVLVLFCIAIYLDFKELSLLDYLTTFLSLYATYLLMIRILESWLIWIVVDILSVIMFFQSKMYITSLLYFIFLIMAIVGYIQWKKTLRYV